MFSDTKIISRVRVVGSPENAGMKHPAVVLNERQIKQVHSNRRIGFPPEISEMAIL